MEIEKDEESIETINPNKDLPRESEILDSELMNQIINEAPSGKDLPQMEENQHSYFKAKKIDKSLEEDSKSEHDSIKASHDDIEKEWKELEEKL